MRETGGHSPPVEVLVLSQLLALFQRDRYTRLRLNQQVVLGKETSEQHAVPVLVRAFVHQAIDGLSSRTHIQPIAELASVGTQPPAQRTLHRNPCVRRARGGVRQASPMPRARRPRPPPARPRWLVRAAFAVPTGSAFIPAPVFGCERPPSCGPSSQGFQEPLGMGGGVCDLVGV